jgi:hypothetical protein
MSTAQLAEERDKQYDVVQMCSNEATASMEP